MKILGVPFFIAVPVFLVTVLVVCAIIALVKYILRK